ncbi:hypothetical protein BJ170DRAFT_721465 [Xylariales sp. AK1849]|nr:hypothetical protein BJ170DRAFT_721465 [Xylariales sp. AK1849]
MPPRHIGRSRPQDFTCTFCWHLSRGPPHVLGSSNRLTCGPCYNALIDLAICWVCGEVVYRGNDRRITQGTKVEELFDDDEESDTEGDEEGQEKAKETTDIPLCANCVVDTELDSPGQGTVVQKALKRIDMADGGMSRKRWEQREGIINAQGTIQRTPAKISKVPDKPRSRIRDLSSRFATDGVHENADDGHGNHLIPLESAVYVSILDPIGLPAFKPTLTKPIPRWMQQLPSQRHPQKQVQPRPRSVLDDHFSDVTSASAEDIHHRGHNTVCPTDPVQATVSLFTPPQQSGHRDSQYSEYDDLPDMTFTMSYGRNISFVTNEPLKRPSSRVMNQPISDATSYTHVQEAYPSPSQRPASTQPRRTSSRPSHDPRPLEPSSEHSSGKESSRRIIRPSRTSSDPIAAAMATTSHLNDTLRRTPPSQSIEYLNLYKPAQSRVTPGNKTNTINSSIGVAGRKRTLNFQIQGRDQPTVKMTRQHSRSSTNIEVTGDGRESPAENGRRPMIRKRSSLQADLKKLFGRRGGSPVRH